MWMNEWDVEEAVDFWQKHPTLGPATQTLQNLVNIVNRNSDGWPYWQKPSRAANKLRERIDPATNTKRGWGVHRGSEFHDPTAAEVRKTYTPIKAFITGMGGGNYAIELVEPRQGATV